MQRSFVTRFAPTPSGPLHLGSLIAALGSYLFVKSSPMSGQWRIRIDDLDENRVVPGASDEILRQLETLGLFWDGAVVYQSKRRDRYDEVLRRLQVQNLIFACSCSRRSLDDRGVQKNRWGERVYPGYCEALGLEPGTNCSLRVRLLGPNQSSMSRFFDLCAGEQRLDILQEWGFPVLFRADGVVAYHLANVVDDQHMDVSHVIRGADLIGAAHVHSALTRLLGFPVPQYGHLGLLCDASGQKLGKSTGAPPVGLNSLLAAKELRQALVHLGFEQIPDDLVETGQVLDWAISICREKHEQIERFPTQLWFGESFVAMGSPNGERG